MSEKLCDNCQQVAMKQRILDTVDDLVRDLLVYDRKEDKELGPGAIERRLGRAQAIEEEGEIFAFPMMPPFTHRPFFCWQCQRHIPWSDTYPWSANGRSESICGDCLHAIEEEKTG